MQDCAKFRPLFNSWEWIGIELATPPQEVELEWQKEELSIYQIVLTNFLVKNDSYMNILTCNLNRKHILIVNCVRLC